MKFSKKLRSNVVKVMFLLVGGVMLIDFFLGENLEMRVESVNRITQSHNNASGNSHFTYLIKAQEIEFYASQSFARSVSKNSLIHVEKSRIFKEVNRASSEQNVETYSLRWASGLIVPLVCMAILSLSLFLRKAIDFLVVLSILTLLGNLFLLLY